MKSRNSTKSRRRTRSNKRSRSNKRTRSNKRSRRQRGGDESTSLPSLDSIKDMIGKLSSSIQTQTVPTTKPSMGGAKKSRRRR